MLRAVKCHLFNNLKQIRIYYIKLLYSFNGSVNNFVFILRKRKPHDRYTSIMEKFFFLFQKTFQHPTR